MSQATKHAPVEWTRPSQASPRPRRMSVLRCPRAAAPSTSLSRYGSWCALCLTSSGQLHSLSPKPQNAPPGTLARSEGIEAPDLSCPSPPHTHIHAHTHTYVQSRGVGHPHCPGSHRCPGRRAAPCPRPHPPGPWTGRLGSSWPPAASPRLQTAPERQTGHPADRRAQQHALWAARCLSIFWLRTGRMTS